MAGFFVILFLFGQSIATWALLSSHFAAWLIGLGFSAAGIAIAFFSLISHLEKQHRIIERLERKVERSTPPSDKPPTSPPRPEAPHFLQASGSRQVTEFENSYD